ncbi:MAG: tRNA (guanosine(46)-N7)-methyltransferase TrmB [Saprospiraceae bacterium]|nr:tRNA (guanosine(46)-N7)-methyltransferase TrmB [Saprospiraceae bacterium]
MSRRNKLEKFAELLTFKNVYQNYSFKDPSIHYLGGELVERKGRWAQTHFKNDHPIVLELACGWGEYTLELARQVPDQNFMGVDVKGNRIWKGAKSALDQALDNVAFLRTRIEQIEHFFEKGEVSEIWITFPDPFLRKSKSNRRLTAAHFLRKYQQILPEAGIVHLKTDSPELYDFTLETLQDVTFCEAVYSDEDIYGKSKVLPHPALEIQTKYERMHLEAGKTIKYVRIRMSKTWIQS